MPSVVTTHSQMSGHKRETGSTAENHCGTAQVCGVCGVSAACSSCAWLLHRDQKGLEVISRGCDYRAGLLGLQVW